MFKNHRFRNKQTNTGLDVMACFYEVAKVLDRPPAGAAPMSTGVKVGPSDWVAKNLNSYIHIKDNI